MLDQGAIEGPTEFAEGLATGVLTLVGSTVGTTAGAVSKITGVIGQSLATLTFDDEYQKSRIHRKEIAGNPVKDIAVGGTNIVKVGFANNNESSPLKYLLGIRSWSRWGGEKTHRWREGKRCLRFCHWARKGHCWCCCTTYWSHCRFCQYLTGCNQTVFLSNILLI